MHKRLFELLVIFVIFKIIYCLQVIPERCNMTFTNSKYVEGIRIYVKRYGRKSPYYLNLEGRNTREWNNNVTVHIIFNEFLHNEYRRSFIEGHFKFCDFLTEPYIGNMVAKQGITCPLPANYHRLLNMTVQADKFPNVFPFEKGRVDFDITLTSSGESIMKGYVCGIFKDKKKLV